MDSQAAHQSHIICLFCGGKFLYPGPKYPLHLFTCHGVVENSHRDYLVRASEYQMTHGELPEIEPAGEDITMNSDRNDNHHCVGVGDSQDQDDYVSVQRVSLTPIKNRDPRLRRAQSTPRRNWNGEDDKSRDPDFALGKGKKSRKHHCATCGRYYASRSTLLKHQRQVCEGKSGRVVCVTCGRYYASKDTLNKHQRLVCQENPLYQARGYPVTSTPNPYNNNDDNDTEERNMTIG